MATNVAKEAVGAYAFEVVKDDEDLVTIVMTWKVPYTGGFELVRSRPIVDMPIEEIATIVFEDLTDAAETDITAAGYTLTGDWPDVT